jgi:pimeloyl-ACP methyl ester carboxylesterase
MAMHQQVQFESEQERADARATLASMGFPRNAHTEALLRKHCNNLDAIIAELAQAAVSGASISTALAGYGTDMYIREYEAELGKPWENPEAYMKVSYPFLNAGKITTPTLFLCGERDFNVPLLNSEQMYQALKSRGVDTRLVIYPGQFHGIDIPSYVLDRMRRYLDWYGRFIPVSAPANE